MTIALKTTWSIPFFRFSFFDTLHPTAVSATTRVSKNYFLDFDYFLIVFNFLHLQIFFLQNVGAPFTSVMIPFDSEVIQFDSEVRPCYQTSHKKVYYLLSPTGNSRLLAFTGALWLHYSKIERR